mgnify:CR=1 FL=1
MAANNWKSWSTRSLIDLSGQLLNVPLAPNATTVELHIAREGRISVDLDWAALKNQSNRAELRGLVHQLEGLVFNEESLGITIDEYNVALGCTQPGFELRLERVRQRIASVSNELHELLDVIVMQLDSETAKDPPKAKEHVASEGDASSNTEVTPHTATPGNDPDRVAESVIARLRDFDAVENLSSRHIRKAWTLTDQIGVTPAQRRAVRAAAILAAAWPGEHSFPLDWHDWYEGSHGNTRKLSRKKVFERALRLVSQVPELWDIVCGDWPMPANDKEWADAGDTTRKAYQAFFEGHPESNNSALNGRSEKYPPSRMTMPRAEVIAGLSQDSRKRDD